VIFYRDFLLLIDVNEWINKECGECVLPHLNIRDWFICQKEKIALEIARVNGRL
jgi:hypothetical protein